MVQKLLVLSNHPVFQHNNHYQYHHHHHYDYYSSMPNVVSSYTISPQTSLSYIPIPRIVNSNSKMVVATTLSSKYHPHPFNTLQHTPTSTYYRSNNPLQMAKDDNDYSLSSSSSSSKKKKKKRKKVIKKGFDPSIQESKYIPFNQGTMDTALCIVPPDDAWDNIQRARHLTRDPTFYQWPPTIRLFHPFLPKSQVRDTAISLANLIETCNIESFDITLDQLLIVPHLEVLEELEQVEKELPSSSSTTSSTSHDAHGNDNGSDGGSGSGSDSGSQSDVEALIQAEEEKGKRKLQRRLKNEENKKKMNDPSYNENTTIAADTIDKEQQQQQQQRQQ